MIRCFGERRERAQRQSASTIERSPRETDEKTERRIDEELSSSLLEEPRQEGETLRPMGDAPAAAPEQIRGPGGHPPIDQGFSGQ